MTALAKTLPWGRILPLFLLWVAAPGPLYIWAIVALLMQHD